MWLVLQNAILTKDSLNKCKWQGDVTCAFCTEVYAMGLAAICWAIWKCKNTVCFDNKEIKSPTEIVCMICSFLNYWAGLLKGKLETQVSRGV